MAMGDGLTGGWDGWMPYTSTSGHKYYWNHLTHESRWITKEPSTQQQKPHQDLDKGKDVDKVEAGEDKICRTHGSMTRLQTGTWPMTMSDVDRVQKTVFPSPTGAKTSYDREHHRSQSPALRRCDRTPRDSQPSAQRAESSRNTAANNKKEITVTLVGELVVLSHQTIASVVHATLRAAVDSWTGLASAARKALRKWKLNHGLDGPILPITVDKSDSDENLPRSDETLLHESQDHGGQMMGRAPFLCFLPKARGPPSRALSCSPSDVTILVGAKRSGWQSVRTGRSTVEGLRESVEEVVDEGVTEEQKSRYNLDPFEVVGECDSKKCN